MQKIFYSTPTKKKRKTTQKHDLPPVLPCVQIRARNLSSRGMSLGPYRISELYRVFLLRVTNFKENRREFYGFAFVRRLVGKFLGTSVLKTNNHRHS